MARYRVLRWRGIPSQVRAQDGSGRITLPLPERFQQEIDRVAMREGLAGTDDYLAGWEWSEDAELPGSAAEVGTAVVDQLVANWRTDG